MRVSRVEASFRRRFGWGTFIASFRASSPRLSPGRIVSPKFDSSPIVGLISRERHPCGSLGENARPRTARVRRARSSWRRAMSAPFVRKSASTRRNFVVRTSFAKIASANGSIDNLRAGRAGQRRVRYAAPSFNRVCKSLTATAKRRFSQCCFDLVYNVLLFHKARAEASASGVKRCVCVCVF